MLPVRRNKLAAVATTVGLITLLSGSYVYENTPALVAGFWMMVAGWTVTSAGCLAKVGPLQGVPGIHISRR